MICMESGEKEAMKTNFLNPDTDVEKLLLDVGAIPQNDVRLQRKAENSELNGQQHKSIKTGGLNQNTGADSDDDWD